MFRGNDGRPDVVFLIILILAQLCWYHCRPYITSSMSIHCPWVYLNPLPTSANIRKGQCSIWDIGAVDRSTCLNPLLLKPILSHTQKYCFWCIYNSVDMVQWLSNIFAFTWQIHWRSTMNKCEMFCDNQTMFFVRSQMVVGGTVCKEKATGKYTVGRKR